MAHWSPHLKIAYRSFATMQFIASHTPKKTYWASLSDLQHFKVTRIGWNPCKKSGTHSIKMASQTPDKNWCSSPTVKIVACWSHVPGTHQRVWSISRSVLCPYKQCAQAKNSLKISKQAVFGTCNSISFKHMHTFYKPSLQVFPVQPWTQLQVSGAEQVPPFWQVSEQMALNRVWKVPVSQILSP